MTILELQRRLLTVTENLRDIGDGDRPLTHDEIQLVEQRLAVHRDVLFAAWLTSNRKGT